MYVREPATTPIRVTVEWKADAEFIGMTATIERDAFGDLVVVFDPEPGEPAGLQVKSLQFLVDLAEVIDG